MRPDFRLLHGHTISGLAYLNGTRLVKTTGVFPPWNRQSWAEKERKRLQSMLNHRKHRGWGGWGGCKQGWQCLHENREVRKHNSSKQYNSVIWSECAPYFSQVFVSEVKQQVSDWHFTDVCAGRVMEACWDLSFPPDPSMDTHVAYWSRWQWSWQIAFCMELMREEQMYAAPLEILRCASACASDIISCVYM